MANLRFLIANIVDDAIVTADPAVVSTLPVTNLQLPTERGRVMRSTSDAQQDVKLTWASNQIANTLWYSRNNGTTGGTGQPLLYSAADWTSNTYTPTASALAVTSGLDAIDADRYLGRDFRHLKNTVLYFPERSDIRSAIWRLADSSNPDEYHEGGKLLIGKYRELRYNPPQEGGVELVQMDSGKGSRADDGTHIVDKGWKARRFTLNLEWVDDATDVEWLLALGRYCGLDRELGLDLYPDDATAKGIYNRMVCRLVSHPGIGPSKYGLHRSSLVFEET